MTTKTVMIFRPNKLGQEKLLRDPNGSVGQALARIAVRVQNRARELSPVDTGLLRSRIDVVPPTLGASGLECAVVARTNYAIYVHEGTSRMPPNPFLLDAAKAVLTTL